MTKVIVMYHTQFGNTEKIAHALASGLGEQGIDVDCMNIEDVEVDRLAEYDLLAIGSPTHMRGASKPVKSFLETLERAVIKDQMAFAFDTKYKGFLAGSAGKGIEKRLKRIGMRIVRPSASAIVTGGEGPLQDSMEETFKQIGIEIARLL